VCDPCGHLQQAEVVEPSQREAPKRVVAWQGAARQAVVDQAQVSGGQPVAQRLVAAD